MKRKHVIFILFLISILMFASCKNKKINQSQLIYGKWKLFISEEEERQMRTGKQMFVFVFNRDHSGLFYYYNIDYSTGSQYARKNKKFNFKIVGENIEMNWQDDNSTDRWPFSFREENKYLILSDPSPGGQTFVLERASAEE